MAAAKYPQRKIGEDSVSAQGLGCMGMSFAYTSYGGYDDDESLKVLTKAADLGITFWDTSDIYGPKTNERLIGKWFKENAGRRKEIFLATKFGNLRGPDGSPQVRGDKEWVHQACNESLERLGIDQIDLYYQHRVDDKVPIEETVGAMVELKNQGKIRYLGLSECSAATLRRAHAVHPIAAAQMEFSPFALEIESEQTNFLKTARELGVKIVAYSPLGRGFLTGDYPKARKDLDEKDSSSFNHPRFLRGQLPEQSEACPDLFRHGSQKRIVRQDNWLWLGFWRKGDIQPPSLGSRNCSANEATERTSSRSQEPNASSIWKRMPKRLT